MNEKHPEFTEEKYKLLYKVVRELFNNPPDQLYYSPVVHNIYYKLLQIPCVLKSLEKTLHKQS